MTINEVEKQVFWIDSNGEVWRRLYYCLQPTVTFEQITNEYKDKTRKSGAIGCPLFEDFKPLMTKEEHDNLNTNR